MKKLGKLHINSVSILTNGELKKLFGGDCAGIGSS
jgi:natural product precursor